MKFGMDDYVGVSTQITQYPKWHVDRFSRVTPRRE